MFKLSVESLTEENFVFDKENSDLKEYSPIPKTMIEAEVKLMVLRDENILAQMIFIPNTLSTSKSCIFTNLVVRKGCESLSVVQNFLIMAAQESYKNNIFFGYYWLPFDQGICSRAWYRPLILKKAKRLEYELTKKANYLLPSTDEYEIRPTWITDFSDILSSTIVRLMPTEEEFESLSETIKFFTVRPKDEWKVLGIVGYQECEIYKNGYNFKAIKLCYFDSSQPMAVPVLSILFNRLKADNYVVIHGVLMSNMEKAIKDLNITLTEPTSLNLIGEKQDVKKITEVAVLAL